MITRDDKSLRGNKTFKFTDNSTYDWLQIRNKVRMFVDTIETTAETFALLSYLEMLTWTTPPIDYPYGASEYGSA